MYLADSVIFIQRMKKKSKGGQQQDAASQEDRWMSQIIVADSLLLQSVLTFSNQDMPSYIKGSCVRLQSCWIVII